MLKKVKKDKKEKKEKEKGESQQMLPDNCKRNVHINAQLR